MANQLQDTKLNLIAALGPSPNVLTDEKLNIYAIVNTNTPPPPPPPARRAGSVDVIVYRVTT